MKTDHKRIHLVTLGLIAMLAMVAGGQIEDPELASHPSPADGQTVSSGHIRLSWRPGEGAATHDVYLGTSIQDVSTADIRNSLGTLISLNQEGNSLDVEGLIQAGQTYYWRVDEVTAAPDYVVSRGVVWSFTNDDLDDLTQKIGNIVATASSSHSDDMGPENTINGSGLDEFDQHDTRPTDMWLSGMGDPTPSIQYEFDQAYAVQEMWVWNSNQLIEPFIGLGAKEVVIEHSLDGSAWTVLEGINQVNQAPGSPAYTANTIVDFAGATARFVRITVHAGYGMLPQYGLSEVRFYAIPTQVPDDEPDDLPQELRNILATASSSQSDNMGPENTVNGIGLDAEDQHTTEGTKMWLSGIGDAQPWIQYEFDQTYALQEMWVWNSNQLIEKFVGLGAKDVVIEYSPDSTEWTVLEGANLFNQAPGSRDYTANTMVDFGGAMARFVRITIHTGYGLIPQYGLSEVRFYGIPTAAPGNDLTQVLSNILATASGSQADKMGPEKTIDGSGLDELDQHDTLATRMWLSAAGDDPAWIQYEFDQAYALHEMWVWNSNQLIERFIGLGAKDVSIETSVDGENWTVLENVPEFAQAPGSASYTANTIVGFGGIPAKYVRLWIHDGWGMMPQYGLSEVRFIALRPLCGGFVLDDFEAYDDNCNRIFFAWQDGLGHNGGTDIEDCEVPSSNGNGGGSIVGHDIQPFTEQVIVNSGKQSMPISYDNSFGTSEVKLALDRQNWKESGIETLSLAFYGAADNTGELFIRINDMEIAYDGDPAHIALAQWQTWEIDLGSTIDELTNVAGLTIGVNGDKAKGSLYIDDISLAGSACDTAPPDPNDSLDDLTALRTQALRSTIEEKEDGTVRGYRHTYGVNSYAVTDIGQLRLAFTDLPYSGESWGTVDLKDDSLRANTGRGSTGTGERRFEHINIDGGELYRFAGIEFTIMSGTFHFQEHAIDVLGTPKLIVFDDARNIVLIEELPIELGVEGYDPSAHPDDELDDLHDLRTQALQSTIEEKEDGTVRGRRATYGVNSYGITDIGMLRLAFANLPFSGHSGGTVTLKDDSQRAGGGSGSTGTGNRSFVHIDIDGGELYRFGGIEFTIVNGVFHYQEHAIDAIGTPKLIVFDDARDIVLIEELPAELGAKGPDTPAGPDLDDLAQELGNILATASSSHSDDMGPENTINGSGLDDELHQHSTRATDMWLSSTGDPTPWIQYELDQAYALGEMWVWNSNQLIEPFVGMGAKDVTIEYSLDGTEWTVLEGANLFNQATGSPTYTANTIVDFAGAAAKFVRITVNAGYGMLPQYGLSEVQFFAHQPATGRGR